MMKYQSNQNIWNLKGENLEKKTRSILTSAFSLVMTVNSKAGNKEGHKHQQKVVTWSLWKFQWTR